MIILNSIHSDSALIHPSSILEGEIHLEEGVEIGPYCHLIGPLRIGKNSIISSYCYIKGPAIIGERNRFNPNCVIGTQPESKGKDATGSISIGNDNTFTEFTVITHGTSREGTRIGDGNFFLRNVHISHDCNLGNDVTLAHNVVLAGHVSVQDGANIGISSSIHQFSTIGAYSMIGMNSVVTKDIPPFVLAFGNPVKFQRWNSYQLKKLGIEDIPSGEIYEKYNLEFHSTTRRSVLPIDLAETTN